MFNPEKVKITLQKMGDQISYLTVVLGKKNVTCICGCAEKSPSNE